MNKISNRVMFLSPTVQAGWQNESFRSDFQNIAVLGQGTYGIVWKAKHKKTGAIYAIKQIKKKSITHQKMLQNVRNQVKIMYCLNHPHIIKLYNHFQDEFCIYFILEFAEKGELYKSMLKSNNKKFQQKTAAKYISQIAHALQYIHKMNIIHRDIKPQNVLIGVNDELKLADFGWSNFNHGEGKRQTYCGTLDYLAPQMVDKSHLHDYRVDIWSLGVLIYQLATGLSPFSSELMKNKNVTENGIKDNITKLNYQFPVQLSIPCRDLISKILVIQPKNRISIAEILEHPWLSKAQVKIEKPIIEKEDWRMKLKHDFGLIYDNKQKQESVKKYQIFSKEQIYDCTRLQSIVNVSQKQKKGQINSNNSEKKAKQYEMKVKQLQLINKRQQEELKYLRNIKAEHQLALTQMVQLRQQNKQYAKKMEMMALKIQEYQKIMKDKEKSKP